MDFLKDDSDSYTEKHQIQGKEVFKWLLVFLNGAIFSGWVIGHIGLSIVWLMMLMITMGIVWSLKLVYFIDDAKNLEIMKVRRRKALNRHETAEWLNILVNRWWVLSSKSIFQLVRERLEPLLNEAKPTFLEKIELKHLSFGDQTPCIKSVKTYDLVDGKRSVSNRFLPIISEEHSVQGDRRQYKVVLEVDLFLNSEEFRLLLVTRLRMGIDMDIAIEKLNIYGKVECILTMNLNSPFPHVTDISIMFTEKPKVWFSIRMFKAVQMMEIPILKTWIHSACMDVLETAIVDPEVFHIPLFEPEYNPGVIKGVSAAQGVLAVSFSTSQFSCPEGGSSWITLKIGSQCFKSSKISPNWNESSSFLVESLQTDKLIIKLKSKRLISNVKLAEYEMILNEYNLDNAQIVETVLPKKSPKGFQVPNICVRLEFTKLPKVSLEAPMFRSLDSSVVSGVLTIIIHSAQGLIFSDTQRCSSYCVLYSNKRKIFTTHCVDNTTSPEWESRCQILVNDYTNTVLSFVVCSSRSTSSTSNDEMLGVVDFKNTQGEVLIKNRQLALDESSKNSPSIIVSVIFQPVGENKNETSGAPSSSGSEIDSRSDSSNGKSRNTYSFAKQKIKRSILVEDEAIGEVQRGLNVTRILSNGCGLMEVSLIQARDLITIDTNRLSDPYCELKVNGECKYKSSVKKKTQNPVWEESTILAQPRAGETFDILIWDRSTFGRYDFLGSVVFTLDEIQEISASDTPKWHALQGVRSGAVELKLKKIPEILPSEDNSSKPVFQESPLPRRSLKERSQVKLGISIPPPVPPRIVSVPHRRNIVKDKDSDNLSFEFSSFHSDNSDSSAYSSFQSLSNAIPRTNISKEKSSLAKTNYDPPPDNNDSTPELSFSEGLRKQTEMEPNPFRSMKEKFTKSLRLRRFKSEVNVRQNNKMESKEKDETSPGFIHQAPLSHATSQPNIRNGKTEAVRPTELNVNPMARPDKYTGVEGKVIQAQGLHVAHVAQLYCRIKLLGIQNNEKNSKHSLSNSGKTLAKSHFLPAVPNPQFDLSFQINSPDSIPRQALLLFEIRSSGKEVVAVRKVALQDLLSNEGKETHTWLALSNGATLEVIVAHGRELKKQTKKLFRSWSVHRIGKV